MINYKNFFNLQGKNAYVIGGAGMIGQAIVIALSSFGANTNILDIDRARGKKLENKLRSKNLRVNYIYFDCTKKININDKIYKLFSKLGLPDIMINASYPRSSNWANSNFKDITFDTLKENIEKNLLPYSWLPKVFADTMKVNKLCGSIINIGSIYGVIGQNLNYYTNTKMKENMIYTLIKGALINHTKQMASYYGKYNIRVNIISPGGIKGHIAGKSKKQDLNFIKNYTDNVPLKRMCKSSDIANAAIFLSSDASNYITGVNLLVDGGITSVL